MEKKIGELDLELGSVDVYGHDSFLDKLNCEVLELAVQDGQDLPRVDVVIEKGVYRLVYGEYEFGSENYGGHGRTSVALGNGGLLKCNLWRGHPIRPFGSYSEKRWTRVADMNVVEFRDWERLIRVKKNLSFLPKSLALEFMKKNDLVLAKNGLLVAGEDYMNLPPF